MDPLARGSIWSFSAAVLLAAFALGFQRLGIEVGVAVAATFGILATLIGFTFAVLISVQGLVVFFRAGRGGEALSGGRSPDERPRSDADAT